MPYAIFSVLLIINPLCSKHSPSKSGASMYEKRKYAMFVISWIRKRRQWWWCVRDTEDDTPSYPCTHRQIFTFSRMKSAHGVEKI